MTDKQIINGNKLCATLPPECRKCPYERKPDCVQHLTNDTIDLFNRKNAEIERLKVRNNELNALNKTASIEAVRGFAERLKNLTASYWLDNINVGHIDKIVEEMVGDDK